VLETLVVRDASSLYPSERYARMRNVWCVPSTHQLLEWMQQAGFQDVNVIDISTTTIRGTTQHSVDALRVLG
jgi:tRNA (mo5U34)-methyltransferase